MDMDIKNNKGVLKNRKSFNWKKPHGLRVEFFIDGRVQLNGEGGLLTYLEGTALVNPHLQLEYKLLDKKPRKIPRVSEEVPKIPPASLPHPHTMKLGEFLKSHKLLRKNHFKKFLKTGFSRISDMHIKEMEKKGLSSSLLNKSLKQIQKKN